MHYGLCSHIIDIYIEQNSVDPNVMKTLLSGIISNYPALSYGLILWLHGISWFPRSVELNSNQTNMKRRFF